MNDNKEQVNVDVAKEAVVEYLLEIVTKEPILEEDVNVALRDFLKDAKESGETVIVD